MKLSNIDAVGFGVRGSVDTEAGMVNLFNPSMFTLGGEVARIGSLFLQPIQDEVHRCSLPAALRMVRIQTAVLRRRPSSMGAVVSALSLALRNLAEPKRKGGGCIEQSLFRK